MSKLNIFIYFFREKRFEIFNKSAVSKLQFQKSFQLTIHNVTINFLFIESSLKKSFYELKRFFGSLSQYFLSTLSRVLIFFPDLNKTYYQLKNVSRVHKYLRLIIFCVTLQSYKLLLIV